MRRLGLLPRDTLCQPRSLLGLVAEISGYCEDLSEVISVGRRLQKSIRFGNLRDQQIRSQLVPEELRKAVELKNRFMEEVGHEESPLAGRKAVDEGSRFLFGPV